MNYQHDVIQLKRKVKRLKKVPLLTAESTIRAYQQAVSLLLPTVTLLGAVVANLAALKIGEDSLDPSPTKDVESLEPSIQVI